MTQQSHFWVYILKKWNHFLGERSSHIHCSIIHNSHDVETTCMPALDDWIKTLWSKKAFGNSIHRPWRHYTKWNKASHMHAKSLQSCPTLCNPMNYRDSLPGSSVHGILQARTREWVAMPSPRTSSWPRDRTHVSYGSPHCRQILYHWATREAPI